MLQSDAFGPVNLPPIHTNNNSVNLPSINQSVILPAIDNPALLSSARAPLFRQGFETDMIRRAYMKWLDDIMAWTFDNPTLYHAVMSFSFGFLAIKTGSSRHRQDSDKHRYIALHELQAVLTKGDINSTDALIACSIILSWDVFFQDENAVSYSTLSKGFPAILERAQMLSPSPTITSVTEALFQGARAIQFPPYDISFLYELVDKVHSIESYIRSSENMQLIREHHTLCLFISDVLDFFRTNHREYKASWSGAKYFGPKDMFRFIRGWYKIFPVMGLSSLLDDSRHNEYSIILYTYYHAVTRALDALFPEVRYMFQFGFIGPVDLVAIENAVSGLKISSTESYLLSYPLKVLVFFKERLFLLNRLLIGTDNSAPVPIREVYVKSFEKTVLGPEHYPSLDEPSSSETLASGCSVYSSSNVPISSKTSSVSSSDTITSPPIPSASTPSEPPQAEKAIHTYKRYIQDRLEILQNINK